MQVWYGVRFCKSIKISYFISVYISFRSIYNRHRLGPLVVLIWHKIFINKIWSRIVNHIFRKPLFNYELVLNVQLSHFVKELHRGCYFVFELCLWCRCSFKACNLLIFYLQTWLVNFFSISFYLYVTVSALMKGHKSPSLVINKFWELNHKFYTNS